MTDKAQMMFKYSECQYGLLSAKYYKEIEIQKNRGPRSIDKIA